MKMDDSPQAQDTSLLPESGTDEVSSLQITRELMCCIMAARTDFKTAFLFDFALQLTSLSPSFYQPGSPHLMKLTSA